MKTNELMIGSWVLINHCSGYKRVTGIDKNGEDIYTTGGVVDIGLLKPVPLTSEILEANGFKLHEDEVGMYGVTLAPYYVTDGSPRIFCDGDPFAVGGAITAISLTPATCAGTTVMSTEDGYAAAPPGTHTPTRRSGRYRCASQPPGRSIRTVVLRIAF